MGAVHVGVGHDDNALIAQVFDAEALAKPGAESRGEVRQLLVARELLIARAGDVQDLAAQREHGLRRAIARLLG